MLLEKVKPLENSLDGGHFYNAGLVVMKKYLTSGNFIWVSDFPQIVKVSLA